MAYTLPPDVIARIRKLAELGWSNASISRDAQVTPMTARKYANQARAEVKARAVVGAELESLRAIISGLYRGRCAKCQGPIVAMRSQGLAQCPKCMASVDVSRGPGRA